MQLSKNFELHEFTDSPTATQLGINNANLSLRTIDNIKGLVNNILQPLRDECGLPVTISSGYRCDRLNAAVGGVPSSQHRLGQASDIKVKGLTPFEIARTIIRLKLPYDQLILYPTFVHVSYGPRFRNQLLYNKSYTGKRF